MLTRPGGSKMAARRSHMTTTPPWRLVPALIGALLLLPGCAGGKVEVVPGEVVHVQEEFNFFLHDQGDRYVFPPLAGIQQLFVKKEWKIPDGVTLERPEVNVTTTRVTWSEGR